MSRKIISHIISLAIIIISGNTWAQSRDDGQEYKVVVATGSGANSEKAEKNALSTSVEQVVGSLIDSEVIVTNQYFIQEKIISASNGYIESYDKLKEWQEDGIFFCRIKAKVKSKAIFQKVQAANKVEIATDGASLVAKVETDTISKEGTADILNKQLATLFDHCLKIHTIGEPIPVSSPAKGTTILNIPIIVGVSSDSYLNETKALCDKLDRLCIKHLSFTSMWRPTKLTYSKLADETSGKKPLIASSFFSGGYDFTTPDYQYKERLKNELKNKGRDLGVISICSCTLNGRFHRDDYFVDRSIVSSFSSLCYGTLNIKVSLLDISGKVIESFDNNYYVEWARDFDPTCGESGIGFEGNDKQFCVFPGALDVKNRTMRGAGNAIVMTWTGNFECEIETERLSKVKTTRLEVSLKPKYDNSKKSRNKSAIIY